jgi:hypothetical protein
LKIVAALDRYHRLDARGLPQRLAHSRRRRYSPFPARRRPTPPRLRKLQILAPNALKSVTRRRIL